MTASANLHLPLTKNSKPLSSGLHLRLGDADSTLADELAVPLSSEFPLPLSENERPLSSELPLSLGDGDGDDGPGGNPPRRPKFPSVVSCYQAVIQKAVRTARQESLLTSSLRVADEYHTRFSPSLTIAKRHAIRIYGFVPINHCYHSKYSESWQLTACKQLLTSSFIAVKQAFDSDVSPTIGYSTCIKSEVQQAIQNLACQTSDTQAVELLNTCSTTENNSSSVSSCHSPKVQPAVPVPCRYYPIPEPPPLPPATAVCRPRPPSSRLPLALGHRQVEIPASDLPLNLTCWHDTPALQTSKRDTYIMHTKITADIGGIDVSPLSFKISKNMKGYCWSGEVGISPDDWEKVKHFKDLPKAERPLITVSVNNHAFAIVFESDSRTREFARHTHNLEGRSITARMGADYAVANDRLFDTDNYASQIITQQLQNLPISLESYDVADWLIPADTYSISNKTPIAVIADIAEAVGGYVESHYNDPTLSIKKRWKVNAWDVKDTTPDMIIPSSVIRYASDTSNQNPRYNTVKIIGDSNGFGVYRKFEGRDLEAPTQNNPLYTSADVAIPKGSAVLSDSGVHDIHSLKMPWSDEIPLAELGQIWQVNDLDETWKGLVTGVAIDIQRFDEGEAPKPYQIITFDRYRDK